MDIHQLTPGMLCYTTLGSGYVLEVDIPNQQVLLQREDEPAPFQVHISDVLAENPHLKR
ncbi:hypothetical protein [Oceanisphaera sp. IT1-181]|uniref:hypothetical protein n=1 Tax=Oceanisphaera sp. IT1-181 TaxID=3081199 RepID=UPI0029C9BFA9|nr:hypothetical protein [Oceanisphaera sp. IT1-181]